MHFSLKDKEQMSQVELISKFLNLYKLSLSFP